MSDLNPYEPWRPRPERGRLPDPEEVLKPWRPPGYSPSPSEEPPEERDTEWYSGPARKPDWSGDARDMTAGQKWLIVLTIAILIGGLIAIGVQGPTHVSRIAATGAALWVGLLIALAVSGGWRWYSRVAWAVAGLAGAAACWYFVPTTGGITLAEANRRLNAIRTLPAGEVALFSAGQWERQELFREFPNWKDDIAAAERDWFRRTVTAAVSAADTQRQTDPDAAQESLRKLEDRLTPSPHYDNVWWVLRDARGRVFRSQLVRLEAELERLLKQKQYQKLHARANEGQEKLRRDVAVQPDGIDTNIRLHAIRERAVKQQVADASAALLALQQGKEHARVATEGRRLLADIAPSARAVNLEGVVAEQINNFRRSALTARVDRAIDDMKAALARNDYPAVAELGSRALADLGEEAGLLNSRNDVANRLLPLRQQALLARIQQARSTLDELFAKKSYTAVAAQGETLLRTLQTEAAQTGQEQRLRDSLGIVRKKAVQARLEAARQEVQALLKQDRFLAVGEAGEKAYKEMGVEAGNVGLGAELVRFRDSCRVFADLARKANRDDQ
jgi:hypothetical protein